jgi:hypothetical protein
MLEIIIIICLLLVLLITVQYRRNKKNSENGGINLITRNKKNNINLIGRKRGFEKRNTKYDYYTKKRVRFADEPTYYDCPREENLSERDKFIDEYVFNNRVFCKNKATPIDTPLAEYRRDIFDFREKTNQIANNYSPVDRIDEMIVNNPDLSGMKIADVYDALTSNEFNTNYTSINMPTGDNNISYINDNNGNSNFAGYKSKIY